MFSLTSNPIIYLFHCSGCPSFGNWVLLQLGSCVFSTCCNFLNHKMSQTQLAFPLPTFGVNHFSKKPGSFYWRKVLGTKWWALECAQCCGGVTASSSSQWKQLRNTYTYTNPHTHLYFYMHLPVCDWVHTNPSNCNPMSQNSFHPSHFPQLYPFISLTARNQDFMIYNVFTSLFNPGIDIVSELLTHTLVSWRNKCTNYIVQCLHMVLFAVSFSQNIIFPSNLGCCFLPVSPQCSHVVHL